MPEVSVLAHLIAVTADVDDVAVMHKSVDQSGGHDFIAEDLAPLLKAFVGCEDRGGVLVARIYELEE
jgi:hypothetical protein